MPTLARSKTIPSPLGSFSSGRAGSLRVGTISLTLIYRAPPRRTLTSLEPRDQVSAAAVDGTICSNTCPILAKRSGGSLNNNDINKLSLAYLAELEEATMRRAWGERPPEDRRRIVSAAVIFGQQLESQLAELPNTSDEQGVQRLLMSVMNAAIRDFADLEDISRDEAASFLGDLQTRDYVLEFNEVLETHQGDSGEPLNVLLNRAVESRTEKTIWARHFSSG